MDSLIIGLGNAGSNIIRKVAKSKYLSEAKLYAIDSTMSSISMNDVTRVNIIPIISDENTGAGRNRERGKAMYEYHDSQGVFVDMYDDATKAKAPVILVSSAAGGTGSGSIISCIKSLMENGVEVFPIIITPNKADPTAFHYNTIDLMYELNELGIVNYSIFENKHNDSNYDEINQEVVVFIETILGKHYNTTDLDSIDDQDRVNLLSTPGRIVAINVEGNTADDIVRDMMKKLVVGSQPSWDASKQGTVMLGCSLKSMYAMSEFNKIFDEVISRLELNILDQYRHIVNDDNNGKYSATIIIAGLSRPDMTDVSDVDYVEAKTIGDGLKRPKRPSFMTRGKAVIENKNSTDATNTPVFKWKK